MSDEREPHVKCTEFLTELYPGRKVHLNTEFATPDQWRYQVLLLRLGDVEHGFGIPAAEDKAEIISVTMESYERKSRQENVVSLVGAGQGPNNVVAVGSLPVAQRPQDLPDSAENRNKKRHWWQRGNK